MPIGICETKSSICFDSLMSSEFFILDFDFCLVFCAVADDEEAFDEDDILWLDKEDTDSDRWI
jgi:hypothetical protein